MHPEHLEAKIMTIGENISPEEYALIKHATPEQEQEYIDRLGCSLIEYAFYKEIALTAYERFHPQ